MVALVTIGTLLNLAANGVEVVMSMGGAPVPTPVISHAILTHNAGRPSELADGIVITSATLKDRPPDVPDDWANAEMRTGAIHLPYPVKRESWDSPFDYPGSSRVIVVTDVNREDMDQVAAAYRELFLAAGGGGLGLFLAALLGCAGAQSREQERQALLAAEQLVNQAH